MKTMKLLLLLAAVLGLSLSCKSSTGSDSTLANELSYKISRNVSFVGKCSNWSGNACTLSSFKKATCYTNTGTIDFTFTPGSDPKTGSWTYHNPASQGSVQENGSGSYMATDSTFNKDRVGSVVTLTGLGTIDTGGAGTYSFNVNEQFYMILEATTCSE